MELFQALAQYRDGPETRTALHRFFEGLMPYMERREEISQYQKWDFDNFRFIIHELFLYCIAILVRNERFESAAHLMSSEYYLPGRSEYGRDVMVPFEALRQHMSSLESRNKRLKLNRLAIRADLLKQRCKGVGIPFRDLLQADFVLFMRDHLDRPASTWHWWPETLLYVYRNSAPFEVFARSRSAAYFCGVKVLLGVSSKSALVPILGAFETGEARLPKWEHQSFWPKALLGFDELETKP